MRTCKDVNECKQGLLYPGLRPASAERAASLRLPSKSLLQGSLPPRASLERAFFTRASFQRSSLQRTLFKAASLHTASLQRAFLNETSRQRAALERTFFKGTSLQRLPSSTDSAYSKNFPQAEPPTEAPAEQRRHAYVLCCSAQRKKTFSTELPALPAFAASCMGELYVSP